MTERIAARSVAVCAVCAAATAAADPRVDLDRCAALDSVALRRAVDAELATVLPERRAALGDRVVVVACPDAVTANLQLEPPPTSGPLARSLDLGEVPNELRPRLIALAVVELVEVGALIAANVAPTTAPTGAPPSARSSGVDPTPFANGDRPAPRVATTANTVPGVDVATTAPPAVRYAERPALADGGRLARGRAIAPRVGMRIYPARAVPMLDVALDVSFGVFSVGATAAIGQTDDPLGTVRPFVAAATGGLTLACLERGAIAACTSARLAAGVAAVSATASDPAVAATSATAPYFQLGGQLELAWRGEHRAGILAVDAGWAEGLIALAGTREAARLDGAVVIGSLGVRW